MNIITTESKYEDFFLKDYKNNKCSILYFTASWCGPCKRMYPLVMKIIEELKIDYFNFYKIDIDDNDEIVESFNNLFILSIFMLLLGFTSTSDISLTLILPTSGS